MNGNIKNGFFITPLYELTNNEIKELLKIENSPFKNYLSHYYRREIQNEIEEQMDILGKYLKVKYLVLDKTEREIAVIDGFEREFLLRYMEMDRTYPIFKGEEREKFKKEVRDILNEWEDYFDLVENNSLKEFSLVQLKTKDLSDRLIKAIDDNLYNKQIGRTVDELMEVYEDFVEDGWVNSSSYCVDNEGNLFKKITIY